MVKEIAHSNSFQCKRLSQSSDTGDDGDIDVDILLPELGTSSFGESQTCAEKSYVTMHAYVEKYQLGP